MTEKTNVTISTVTTILFLGVLGAFLWFVVSGNKLAKPGVIVLALLLAAAVGVKIPLGFATCSGRGEDRCPTHRDRDSHGPDARRTSSLTVLPSRQAPL
jgi:hypothetical protein